jgi:hypothetical protein
MKESLAVIKAREWQQSLKIIESLDPIVLTPKQ